MTIARQCQFDPRTLLGVPLGMFHCPLCGCMVVAGIEHGLCMLGLCPQLDGELLTPEQVAILSMASEGSSTTQISEALDKPVDTVRDLLMSSIEALGASSKLEAIIIAIRRGIITT
jgi:DNA-binding CsgD family transcriptional regulator